MRFKLIGCKVLQREIASILYRCPNSVDVSMMRQDYHQTPAILRKALQDEIDRIDDNTDSHTNDLKIRDIDAVLLCYGLCSNAVVGLKSRKYPLVIPRAHDCITLIWGSKEKYSDYFKQNIGSYYYTQGWFDTTLRFGDDVLSRKRQEYMDKYQDEETVDALMEIENELVKNYNCMTYIAWDNIPDAGSIGQAKKIAEEKGWKYSQFQGSPRLLENMLNGKWDSGDFLVVRPGHAVAASWDEGIIKED